MTLIEPRTFRWTRQDYYKLYEQGMFDGRRVELIDGEIVEMPAQKDAHAWSVTAAQNALTAASGAGHWVRPQMPLDLSQWSDPEPDLAVVVGDYTSWKGKGHPKTALLVVEISDKSLRFDRTVKQAIYAAARLQEYWIVNLVDQCLEVFRDPQPDLQNIRASRFGSVMSLQGNQTVAPLAFPNVKIRVADLV